MTEIHPTMKRVFEKTGKTPTEIANAINASPQSITNWSKRGVSKAGAIDIASKFDLSVDWILTGNGEMTTPAKPKIRMAIDDPDAMPPALRDHLTADHGDDELDTDNFEAMMKRYVPVISWVAAGDMTPVMSATLTEVISWAPRLTHLSDMAFGLVVRGRSMLPEFKPDDVIYVEPTFDPNNLRDGDLVVVACDSDGEATFKQLVFGDNANDVYLKPLNPDWHNQEIRPMCECRLVGRVMGKYVVY